MNIMSFNKRIVFIKINSILKGNFKDVTSNIIIRKGQSSAFCHVHTIGIDSINDLITRWEIQNININILVPNPNFNIIGFVNQTMANPTYFKYDFPIWGLIQNIWIII
jgi:hypothetical protein